MIVMGNIPNDDETSNSESSFATSTPITDKPPSQRSVVPNENPEKVLVFRLKDAESSAPPSARVARRKRSTSRESLRRGQPQRRSNSNESSLRSQTAKLQIRNSVESARSQIAMTKRSNSGGNPRPRNSRLQRSNSGERLRSKRLQRSNSGEPLRPRNSRVQRHNSADGLRSPTEFTSETNDVESQPRAAKPKRRIASLSPLLTSTSQLKSNGSGDVLGSQKVNISKSKRVDPLASQSEHISAFANGDSARPPSFRAQRRNISLGSHPLPLVPMQKRQNGDALGQSEHTTRSRPRPRRTRSGEALGQSEHTTKSNSGDSAPSRSRPRRSRSGEPRHPQSIKLRRGNSFELKRSKNEWFQSPRSDQSVESESKGEERKEVHLKNVLGVPKAELGNYTDSDEESDFEEEQEEHSRVSQLVAATRASSSAAVLEPEADPEATKLPDLQGMESEESAFFDSRTALLGLEDAEESDNDEQEKPARNLTEQILSPLGRKILMQNALGRAKSTVVNLDLTSYKAKSVVGDKSKSSKPSVEESSQTKTPAPLEDDAKAAILSRIPAHVKGKLSQDEWDRILNTGKPKRVGSVACLPLTGNSTKVETGFRNTRENKLRSVSFGNVRTRSFQRILDVHPCTSSGPSVGIGWEYEESSGSIGDWNHLKSKDIRLSRDARERMLKDLGYSQKEIAQSVRENLKINNQRRKTINNLESSLLDGEKMEIMKESMKGKFRQLQSKLKTGGKK